MDHEINAKGIVLQEGQYMQHKKLCYILGAVRYSMGDWLTKKRNGGKEWGGEMEITQGGMYIELTGGWAKVGSSNIENP